MTVSLNYLHLGLVFEAAWHAQNRVDVGCRTPSPCSRLPCSSCFLCQEVWSVAMGTWPQ